MKIEGLFVATPPLEALRLLMRWAAASDVTLSGDVAGGRKDKSILIADASRALFEAPMARKFAVELPRRMRKAKT